MTQRIELTEQERCDYLGIYPINADTLYSFLDLPDDCQFGAKLSYSGNLLDNPIIEKVLTWMFYNDFLSTPEKTHYKGAIMYSYHVFTCFNKEDPIHTINKGELKWFLDLIHPLLLEYSESDFCVKMYKYRMDNELPKILYLATKRLNLSLSHNNSRKE